MSSEFYSFTLELGNGEKKSMSEYSGKVVLIVNTASECILTPQYEGFQKLYKKYKDAGLEILAFPCDQFAHQEPGTDEEILQFCKVNYGVSFPVSRKINVNGKNTDPLYKYLKKEVKTRFGTSIKWNFTKFLVDRTGKPVKRFKPETLPEELETEIEALL